MGYILTACQTGSRRKLILPREVHTVEELLDKLRARAVPSRKEGMARFGVSVESALGVTMPEIRAIGAQTVKEHQLALDLWQSGIHEARILASVVDEPAKVTRQQCEDWAADFNSWDIVDQVCGNLLDKTALADTLVREWSLREEEFVKRAAFALIAWMSVHRKKEPDQIFLDYLPLIVSASDDPRNFVKKAVNWALRQIGKRSAALHQPALELALNLQASEVAAARWIGADAVRELQSDKIKARLGLL